MVQFSDSCEVSPQDLKNQLDAACKRLKERGKSIPANDLCVYYTLDYSDAILFVRNCCFNWYQDLLWELTVSVNEEKRLIIDTISLYGVSVQKAGEEFEKIQEDSTGKYPLYPPDNLQECFDLSLFLGVQNATAWNKVKQKLKDKYGENLVFYRKFGRTDITVTFRDFDLKNALYLVWLLFFEDPSYGEQFGSCVIAPRDKLLEDSTDSAKKELENIPLMSEQSVLGNTLEEESNGKTEKKPYQIVENVLIPLYEDANPQLKKLYPPLSGYCTELYQSLLTLLHNSFAEEYYLSVLPSFAAHLKMFGDSIRHGENIEMKDRDEIVNELREYYRGLIMLEHSTLHGEKKFIQAPGLNAFICEVPAKLLVFYTSVAFRIIQYLRDSANSEDATSVEEVLFSPGEILYVPLFIPDFRPDMYSRHILDRQRSTEQINIIYLEERLFYEPEYAIPSMVHELAHRVGDKARQRVLRLKKIFCCLSVYLISSAYSEDFFEIMSPEEAKGINWLANIMANQFVKRFQMEFPAGENGPYLDQVKSFLEQTGVGRDLLDLSIDYDFVTGLVKQWESAFTRNRTDVLLPLLEVEDTRRGTMYYGVQRSDPRRPTVETTFFYSILSRIVDPENDQEGEALHSYWKALLSAFRETYSDLRMIEAVDKLNYHSILDTMFRRKDFENESYFERNIIRYEFREVPVCKALGMRTWKLDRKFPNAQTAFIVEKTQDELVKYLKACRQNKEPNKRISAFVHRGNDIMMIREEIAHYRRGLLQFFEQYADQCINKNGMAENFV